MKKDIYVSPTISLGDLIRKELRERGISQKVFAEALHIRPSHLSEIICGKRSIPDALIPKVAEFVGVHTEQVIEAQVSIRIKSKTEKILSQEDIDAQNMLQEYDEFLNVKSLLRGMGYKAKAPSETLKTLQCFYHLPNSKILSREFEDLNKRCFRRSAKNGLDMRMISTWVIKARKIAGEKPIQGAYDSSNNKELAQKLSVIFHDNDNTVKRVESLLDCFGFGFAIAIVKKEEHASIDGYSFFENGHPYIVVTQRFDRIDNLAFTILHELGHIALGHTNADQTMLSLEENPNDFDFIDGKETEADKFATDNLIPESIWCLTPKVSLNPYVIQKRFTDWARERNLNEWIVLGRVSHETGMYRFKSNKRRTIK